MSLVKGEEQSSNPVELAVMPQTVMITQLCLTNSSRLVGDELIYAMS